ncbi:MAG TPA: cellulose biosynthesis protein BcsS [Beijerinckiaceae bacterium]|nr:cellulose biosynthesis protein BcsS [Beijerinckiaceae bacterium]
MLVGKGVRTIAGLGLVVLGSPAAADEREALRTVLFGGLEAGRGGFASAGFKRTLGPLDQNGFAVLGTAGAGLERDRPHEPGAPAHGRYKVQASLLSGHQWMLGWGAVALFAGPEFDYETVPGDPTARGRPRLGARLQGEAWLHPTEDTLVTLTGIAGSARGHLWTRGSLGYRLREGLFVGPEASLYVTREHREWRLGLHATGLSWRDVRVRLSAGWRQDEDRRGGAYLGLTLHTQR